MRPPTAGHSSPWVHRVIPLLVWDFPSSVCVCVWLRRARWEGMLVTSTSRIAHKGLKVKKNHSDERKDELTKADPARDWDQGPVQSAARSSPAHSQVTAAPCSHKAASVSPGRAEAAAASPRTTGKQTPGLSRGWEFVFLNIT